VLRLLETRDVRELLGEEIYLLWPDDGLWYPADVKKVHQALKTNVNSLCCYQGATSEGRW